jgi:ABC-type amino acid transport substrate-binding protein
MKKLFSIVLLIIALVSLTSCKKVDGLLEDGVLKVATSPDYAPYEFLDLNKTDMNQFVGSDVELMKYLAEKMGVKLEIHQMTFEACLMAVQAQEVDIAISGFSWTPKRANNFEMSIGYFGEGDGEQQLLILKSNAEKYQTLADLNKANVKVGAQAGSIQEEYVDVQLPKASKQVITDLDVALSLLLNGSIDALAISEHAAEVRVLNNNNLTVVSENFVTTTTGFVVVGKKGNKTLINQINSYIEEVTSQNLYAQWLNDAKALAAALGEELFD